MNRHTISSHDREGDIILIIDKDDPSGWWKGELNGKIGFLPTNFVQELN
jgi:hypothetical protein